MLPDIERILAYLQNRHRYFDFVTYFRSAESGCFRVRESSITVEPVHTPTSSANEPHVVYLYTIKRDDKSEGAHQSLRGSTFTYSKNWDQILELDKSIDSLHTGLVNDDSLREKAISQWIDTAWRFGHGLDASAVRAPQSTREAVANDIGIGWIGQMQADNTLAFESAVYYPRGDEVLTTTSRGLLFTHSGHRLEFDLTGQSHLELIGNLQHVFEHDSVFASALSLMAEEVIDRLGEMVAGTTEIIHRMGDREQRLKSLNDELSQALSK